MLKVWGLIPDTPKLIKVPSIILGWAEKVSLLSKPSKSSSPIVSKVSGFN